MSLERHKKKTSFSIASLPNLPITVTVLQSPSPQISGAVCESVEHQAFCTTSHSTTLKRLNLPGFLDKLVEEYCNWQKSRVKRAKTKRAYEKAYDVILDNGMDLELIRHDPNPKFLTNNEVKKGVANHVVSDIDYWAEMIKRARNTE